jgi:hypothetical protein
MSDVMPIKPRAAVRTGSARTGIRPFRQGALDSLCGVYAIVNAARLLCSEIDNHISSALFYVLIKALLNRETGAPSAVTDGITTETLSRLLRTACNAIEEMSGIRLRCSLLAPKRKRLSLDQTWMALQETVGKNSVSIIGLSGIREHWTVGYWVTKREITLKDSDGLRFLSRMDCDVKRDAAPYQLQAHEIVILHRVKTARRA